VCLTSGVEPRAGGEEPAKRIGKEHEKEKSRDHLGVPKYLPLASLVQGPLRDPNWKKNQNGLAQWARLKRKSKAGRNRKSSGRACPDGVRQQPRGRRTPALKRHDAFRAIGQRFASRDFCSRGGSLNVKKGTNNFTLALPDLTAGNILNPRKKGGGGLFQSVIFLSVQYTPKTSK